MAESKQKKNDQKPYAPDGDHVDQAKRPSTLRRVARRAGEDLVWQVIGKHRLDAELRRRADRGEFDQPRHTVNMDIDTGDIYEAGDPIYRETGIPNIKDETRTTTTEAMTPTTEAMTPMPSEISTITTTVPKATVPVTEVAAPNVPPVTVPLLPRHTN